MNLNFKAIAAIAVLAVAAGTSQAALVGPNPGPSDLTFNIWNANTNNAGYTLDLGITAAQLSSPFSVTLSGGALISFIADSTGTLWNVVGAQGNGISGTNNYYTTASSTAGVSDTGAQALSAVNVLTAAYSAFTSTTGNTFGTSSTGSVVTTIANTPYWSASLSQGGGQINDSTDTPAAASGTDTSSSAFFKKLSATGTVESVIAGTWSLVFNAAGAAATSATLTWTPTAVPLPAAVWLLGSGLLGLAGIGRRRGLSPASLSAA